MEDDPDKINDADRALEAHILKAGEFYAESNTRQRAENKKRAENRKRISDLGIRTDAYQTAIKLVKDLTESERKDFIRDLRLVTKVLGGRQAELFPDEAIKAAKRAEKRKEAASKKPRGKGELDATTDANPKSDPKRGGAGKGRKKKTEPEPAPTIGDTIAASDSLIQQTATELEQGASVLDKLLPETHAAQNGLVPGKTGVGSISDERPLSQSAEATAKRNAAGLP